MIGQKMRDAMNEQIKYELESAYLYMSMMAWFKDHNFDGMANWMAAQTMEEIAHAMKFFHHIIEREGKVELLPLGIKKTEWSSPAEAFKDAYEHEQFVTSRINELTRVAYEENDHAAKPMLQWFIDEQVEEEASTSKVAHEIGMVGKDGTGLLMLDRELATRQFTLPTATEEGA
jgi:ferritin